MNMHIILHTIEYKDKNAHTRTHTHTHSHIHTHTRFLPLSPILPQVDVVQAVIRDRTAVASSQETGRDLEHCQVLMKKFEDFQKVTKYIYIVLILTI